MSTPLSDWIGLAVVIGDTVGLAITEGVTDLGQPSLGSPAASCAQPGT